MTNSFEQEWENSNANRMVNRLIDDLNEEEADQAKYIALLHKIIEENVPDLELEPLPPSAFKSRMAIHITRLAYLDGIRVGAALSLADNPTQRAAIEGMKAFFIRIQADIKTDSDRVKQAGQDALSTFPPEGSA